MNIPASVLSYAAELASKFTREGVDQRFTATIDHMGVRIRALDFSVSAEEVETERLVSFADLSCAAARPILNLAFERARDEVNAAVNHMIEDRNSVLEST